MHYHTLSYTFQSFLPASASALSIWWASLLVLAPAVVSVPRFAATGQMAYQWHINGIVEVGRAEETDMICIYI